MALIKEQTNVLLLRVLNCQNPSTKTMKKLRIHNNFNPFFEKMIGVTKKTTTSKQRQAAMTTRRRMSEDPGSF